MYRSFTDRVLGGVCGGLAVDLRVNAWFLRLVFVLLTLVTLGVGALLYVVLWWIMPQESLVQDRRGSFPRMLMVSGVTIVMLGAWVAHQTGGLRTASGQVLLLPILLLVLSVIFLLRQVRS